MCTCSTEQGADGGPVDPRAASPGPSSTTGGVLLGSDPTSCSLACYRPAACRPPRERPPHGRSSSSSTSLSLHPKPLIRPAPPPPAATSGSVRVVSLLQDELLQTRGRERGRGVGTKPPMASAPPPAPPAPPPQATTPPSAAAFPRHAKGAHGDETAGGEGTRAGERREEASVGSGAGGEWGRGAQRVAAA